MKAILGIKKGMTRIFEKDRAIPVTFIDVAGCKIANVKGDKIELTLGSKRKVQKHN